MLLCNLTDGLSQPGCSAEVPPKQCGRKWGGGAGLRDSHMSNCAFSEFFHLPKEKRH